MDDKKVDRAPVLTEKSSGEITERLAGISPAKRALLELRLRKKSSQAAARQRIPRRADRDRAPLSFAQQRIWFLDQFTPGNPAYNVSVGYRLRGLLNVAVLEKSLNEIIRRHEVLRTTFNSSGYEPVALISPELTLVLTLIDLEHQPDSERESALDRHIADETWRSFDLKTGPLLRAKLFRIGNEDHILLLTMHHIINDAWSRNVIYRELSMFYETFQDGDSCPLPELPVQYGDYAQWQRQWLQGERLESHLSFWRKQLSGSLAVLELPLDHPRPAVQTYRGKQETLCLPQDLSQDLKAFSKQEGATLFMTLLAAFQTLLYRYSGQEDIIVGSPIANRTRVETEGLIGFFVNTLVLRTDLSGDPIFRQLLGRVREACLGAYAHQDLPFEKLVEELKPQRDLSRTPLFQVMFNLENLDTQAVPVQGLSISDLECDSRVAPFDLTLEIMEKDEGLSCLFNYNTDLFDAATIERMAGHFHTVLEGIVADPEQRLSELPLLTAAERHQLLVEWNDTKTDYPRDKYIHHLFEEQVERTPDATALVCEDQQMTYRELNLRANQLAHYLQAQGVGPDVMVGICVERSFEMVIGMLGILKAGGAYVPLDPTYPQERLAYMVADTRMPIIVIQERFIKLFPDLKSKIVVLDRDREALVKEPQDNVQSSLKAEHLAYVIYTSGSTGKPKGVMIEHRNAVNLFSGMDDFIEPDLKGTWLAVTSLSFDISVVEIFWTLARGLRVVIYSGNDTRSILELMQLHNVTHFQCTPSMANMLMMDAEAKHALKRLQKFVIGGEAFPVILAEQLQKVVAGDVINGYGPTETTVYSSLYTLILNNDQHSIPIGRPIANTEIYILDKHLQPVPVGVPGELMIGGAGVVRGYLNRPELTAERFIPNPFSDNPARHRYRTGDLCRYLPDGNIEFIGRIDHQVKLRGYRIELGEIEVVLAEHPGVKMAVAVVREDQPGDTRLVAYVVPKEGKAPEVRNLREYLKEKLPGYMVPGAFVILESLPLTPNKKVDRLKLPAPDRIRPEPEETYAAPRTPVEEKLAEIWARVLGLDQVGIYDNFFELGGHSLLATQVISRVIYTFQVKVPLRSLFQAPTVADMAVVIVQKRAEKVESKDIDRLLVELEGLSDGEARRRFADESVKGENKDERY
jgi:aspartate racemase